MNLTIYPSTLQGTIEAAASKSSMQRALAAALLRTGKTIIHNPGNSNDDLAALDTIQKLGAVTSWQDGDLVVSSSGIHPREKVINCGESGLGIRMFTPIAALSNDELTVTGTGSLMTRPMDFFDDIFPKLGIQIKSEGGRLPLVIKGPLKPADIEVDGSLSSQFLTGLLMAYAAAGAHGVTIQVRDLKSRPYIDLTLKVLRDFGWEVEHRNYASFTFLPQKTQPLSEREYRVEGDWSGAAFLLVAGAISGDILVKGLEIDSTQADKAVMLALKDSGANMSIQPEGIRISKSRLQAFQFNASECPDLFPPLVALAAVCEGQSKIEGTHRLTHKESNRALTLQEEFGKMGVHILLEGDMMIIQGKSMIHGAMVHSRHDHRIAMACAVAGLRADGPVTLEEAEAVKKSYPDFYDDLKSLSARIE